MGIFDKMKEPVFLKEDSDMQRQLEILRSLEPCLNEEGKTRIKEDIRRLEYGLAGEQNIAFELKNSHMPMYILHDIYLESGELSAQIDYLVVTRKICFILECKNLYGNIEINQAGDFIRTTEFGRHKKKEGIYSPVTQNQRHLELIKKLKVEGKANLITKKIYENTFYNFYKPVVVLANPNTILSAKYAKEVIREQVVRADQLVNYIKTVYLNSKEVENSDKQLLAWAQSFLEMHHEIQKDYLLKYNQYKIDKELHAKNEVQEEKTQAASEEKAGEVYPDRNTSGSTVSDLSMEETDLYRRLKQFRLEKSREEGIKAYYIFNDSQLRDLIGKNPRSKEELMTVNGFGQVKVEKYGEDILKILSISNEMS